MMRRENIQKTSLILSEDFITKYPEASFGGSGGLIFSFCNPKFRLLLAIRTFHLFFPALYGLVCKQNGRRERERGWRETMIDEAICNLSVTAPRYAPGLQSQSVRLCKCRHVRKAR